MNRLAISAFIVSFIFAGNVVSAQSPAPHPPTTATPAAAPRIIGEVTAINREQHWLKIKIQTTEVTVAADPTVVCKRVVPDAKNLDGAEVITFGDIRPGDRVWARNTSESGVANSIVAKQLVLMSAESIAERNKREREAWMRRGLQGEITAVDTEKKEFAVKLRDGNMVTLALGEKIDMRRYPPGSVDFTASKPITSAEIKVGDKVMARGERSADNQRFTAEMLVTGDIPRPTFGQVTAVNLEKQEITVKMREHETVIRLTSETLLRRMPEDAMTQTNQPPAQGEGQRPQRMGFNPAAMMERLKKAPELKLSELKPGEYIVANGPKSQDGKSLTALFVLRVPTPNNSDQGPGFGPSGGGFGDISMPQ